MKNTLRVKMSGLLLAMALAFVGFTGSASAQYCDFPAMTYYDFYGHLNVATLNETSGLGGANGTQIFQNSTNKNDGYKFFGNVGNIVQGRFYRLTLLQEAAVYFGYPYTSSRVFLDFNGNGKFDVGTVPNEFVGEYRQFSFPTYYTIYHGPVTIAATFGIGCTSPLGDTRLRIITGYYYCPAGTNNACYVNYDYYGWGYCYGEVEDYTLTVQPDAPKSIPSDTPVIINNVKVEDWTIYDAGATYNQDWLGSTALSAKPKPQILFNGANQAGSTMEMYISGPLPSTAIVWRALQPGTNSNTMTLTNPVGTAFTDSDGKTRYRYVPTNATGVDAPGSNGDFSGLSGGEYKFVFQLWSTGGGCPGVANRLFTVAWDNDVAAAAIISPLTSAAPRYTKYGVGQTIKINALYQNVGKNNVTKFTAKAYIRNKSGVLVDSIIYKYDSDVNSADHHEADVVITPSAKVEIAMGDRRYFTVDQYSISLDLSADPGLDQEAYNNTFPRINTPIYPFEIAYDVELQANAIFSPAQGDILIANRTYKAKAEFKNNGISPQSNIPVKMEIRDATTNKLETTVNGMIADIGIGRYNTKTVEYATSFSVSKPGNYIAKIFVTAPQDQVSFNDTLSVAFTVEAGIQGVFTVGSTKETAAGFKTDKNFSTVQEMMDAIYYNGISGPVAFEFTDALYTLTGSGPNPAWDLSSNILGLGYNAENKMIYDITFRPHSSLSGNKAGVVFDMYSNIGVGVRLGQNGTPSNSNSVYNSFPTAVNANNNGYITFNGGAQKTLKFVITNNNPSSKTHASAFFLGSGSKNMTVKNCVIDNGSFATTGKLVDLPTVSYSNNQFVYDDPYPGFSPNSTTLTKSTALFSAGVVLHNSVVSYLASSGTTSSGNLKLDTLPSMNNLIEGNEISNFAYGIADIGYGPLTLQFKTALTDFNNSNNTFRGNFIRNVEKAGIVLGQERNSLIQRNRIMNVGTALTIIPTSGILIGGATKVGSFGFNNNDITIDGNQISGVYSSTNAFGINVEQIQRLYNTGALEVQIFPKNAENTKVTNNVVWGLSNNNANGNRVAINLMTERVANLYTPLRNNYFTRNDMVVNNTILINETAVNTGSVVGVAIQQSNNAGVYNNALSIIDQNINPSLGNTAALIYYQGIKPGLNGGLTSNRNLFYTGNANPALSNVDLFRIVETDKLTSVIYAGFNGEYRTLDQVQSWLKQSENGLYGDFTSDYSFSSAFPSIAMINPNIAKGSLQNNRGENLTWVTADAQNSARGVSGERYDIGAFEFVAPLYNEDVEVVTMTTPRSYQSLTSKFNDAQYIMTTSPTNVTTRIRNNGKLPQTNYGATVKIYRQNADDTYPTTPTVTTSTKLTLATNESAVVDFQLNGTGTTTFKPETFSDLIDLGGNAAYQTLLDNLATNNMLYFSSMKANITPLYKIVVTTGSDENNSNNTVTKYVRYYIKKSDLNSIISATDLNADVLNPLTTPNAVMSKLNSNALISGFTSLGWRIVYPSTGVTAVNNYDKFDRLAWEPRAVNYNDYTSNFWVDGDNTTPSMFEIGDITNYIAAAGQNQFKKNFVVASQEIVRNTTGVSGSVADDFRTNILRASSAANSFGTYENTLLAPKRVTGINIARDLTSKVAQPINAATSTTYTKDVSASPYVLASVNSVTLNTITTALPGLTRDAFKYTDVALTPIAAVATTNLDRNVITLGLDWRHIGDMETMMRGVIDYLVKNTDVIPVELSDFKATKLGNKVVLDWVTASEINTSKFEVERSVVTNTGAASFDKIAELAAAGQSKEVKYYGPVADYNVAVGNTYAYRLRMIDRNGDFSFSDTKFVTLASANGVVELSEAKPNPASVATTFNFSLTQANNVTFTIYDINGNAVSTSDANYAAGNHTYEVNVLTLASGQYNVVLRAGEIVLTKTINVVK